MTTNSHTVRCLRTATRRAKSDVANKLVSMFLHDVSSRMVTSLGMSVTAVEYAQAVYRCFGECCCYCGTPHDAARVVVEHLDGMNRARAGLHVPGNVLVACRTCNLEKRRDDQLKRLVLASSGWESFLSHDSTRCGDACRTCAYWRRRWPDAPGRGEHLYATRKRITAFRSEYAQFGRRSEDMRASLDQELDRIYRGCQSFATTSIREAVERVTTDWGPKVG